MNKVNIYVQHYKPKIYKDQTGETIHDVDSSSIWVTVESDYVYDDWGDKERYGGGYITNPFPCDFFGDSTETFKKMTLSGELISTTFMEHRNGGRTNPKVYNTIHEYISDPQVKQFFHRYLNNRFQYNGEPARVDITTEFKIDGFDNTYCVTDSKWDEVIPQSWYSEHFVDVINVLSKYDNYETASDAINNTKSNDDLFGERFFPVLKAPKALSDVMQNICDNFKGFSRPLYDEDHVYIGIRSKQWELGAINDIYGAGGVILKGKEWDWE